MHIWYVANLLPPALGIFNDDFYPRPRRGSGTQPVFFCLLPDAQGRVLIANSAEANKGQFRILTRELAASILDPREVPKYGYEKATKEQMMKLNLSAEPIQTKFH